MLTTEAFNALLKPLEEPPDSVIFILATTELQEDSGHYSVPLPELSFRRLTAEEIVERLKKVALSNHMTVSAEALELIARRANDGLRDALSALDQVYSYKGSEIDKNRGS